MRPQELELPEGSQVVKVSGGREHALILLKISDHLERVLPQHQENDGQGMAPLHHQAPHFQRSS